MHQRSGPVYLSCSSPTDISCSYSIILYYPRWRKNRLGALRAQPPPAPILKRDTGREWRSLVSFHHDRTSVFFQSYSTCSISARDCTLRCMGLVGGSRCTSTRICQLSPLYWAQSLLFVLEACKEVDIGTRIVERTRARACPRMWPDLRQLVYISTLLQTFHTPIISRRQMPQCYEVIHPLPTSGSEFISDIRWNHTVVVSITTISASCSLCNPEKVAAYLSYAWGYPSRR